MHYWIMPISYRSHSVIKVINKLLNQTKGISMYRMLNKKKSVLTITMLIFISSLFILGGCAGKQLGPGTFMVKGKVKKINLEQGVFFIAPPKGDRVKIYIYDNVQLQKYDSIKSIKKNDPVEVIYMLEGNKNNAISIKQISLGSC